MLSPTPVSLLPTMQIKGIMSEYGSKDAKEPGMKYDGFKEFMIKQLGDTDSPDEIMNGWDMMNRKQAPGVVWTLCLVLSFS